MRKNIQIYSKAEKIDNKETLVFRGTIDGIEESLSNVVKSQFLLSLFIYGEHRG